MSLELPVAGTASLELVPGTGIPAVAEPAELSVAKQGRNTGAIYIIFPLVYISPTEGPACRDLSEAIVAHVTAGK